jgi:hypothetical protein
MLNCWHCGLTHRPMDRACADCGRDLQDAEAAERGRKEWDATPAKIREDWERQFQQGLESRRDYVTWLERHRFRHRLLGAVLTAGALLVALPMKSYWVVPLWLAIGAAAAHYLNVRRGGQFTGALLFAGAYVASLLLSLPFADLQILARGAWLVSAFAIAMVGGFGYLLGLRWEIASFDHYYTR